MVIVDSSVWIDFLRKHETPEVVILNSLAQGEDVGMGDLILYEVLQGVSPAQRFDRVKSYMLRFQVFTMGGRDMVLEAIHNAQSLRAKGVQPGAVDCLVATLCIVTGSQLLTSDHHFQPFADILGLELAG